MLKKHFFSIILLISILNNNNLISRIGTYNETEFQEKSKDYGNKSANLIVLQELLEKANITSIAQVPPFLPISHQAIQNYLEKVGTKQEIDEKWSQFKIKQESNKLGLENEAKAILKDIRDKIIQSFSREPYFTQKNLKSFLQSNQPAPLMVRSTGKEDTKELANAGGNESISSVKPQILDVSEAMGKVVASYFSEKSLSQRLAAGDDILQDPFTPVLLQVMIGEKVGGDANNIPVSGVMFTQEAEGKTPGITQIQSAYGHNEGVVNSLVSVDTFYVGPKSFNLIHPTIRIKSQRLVSVPDENKFKLEMMTNPKEIQKIPSIDRKTILNLKKIGDLIQEYYNDWPTDVEYVIQKNIVYLVQARPITFPIVTNPPSYLTDNYLAGNRNQTTKINIIGTGGNFIREIVNQNQAIIKENLPQALREYNDSNDRTSFKIVIVAQEAPATSHEATTFRSLGIPVIVVENLTKIKSLISNPGNVFIVDVQRAILVNPGHQILSTDIKEGLYSHPIPRQTSLLPKISFIMPQDLASQPAIEVETILRTLFSEEGEYKTIKYKSIRELLEIVKQGYEIEKKGEAVIALKIIINRLSNITQRQWLERYINSKLSFLLPEALANTKKQLLSFLGFDSTKEGSPFYQAKVMLNHAFLYGYEIEKTMEQAQDPENKRIALLYSIKFLEALIFQQIDTLIVDSYSYITLLKLYSDEALALSKIDKEAELSPQTIEYITQFIKLDKLFWNKNLADDWKTFLNYISNTNLTFRTGWQSVDEIINNKELNLPTKKRMILSAFTSKFASIIAKLDKLNLLTLWLHTSFKKIWEDLANITTNKSISCMLELINEFEANKEILEWASQKKDLLNVWKAKASEWENPLEFEKLWLDFNQHFIKAFISGEGKDAIAKFQQLSTDFNYKNLQKFAKTHAPLTKSFISAQGLGKLAILQLLNSVVDVYDASIKGLTGSTEYKNKNLQAFLFAKMLKSYLMLMEEWVTIIPKEIPNKVDYLKNTRKKLFEKSSNSTAASLLPSTDFSVAAAQILNRTSTALSYSIPETLEDLFTVIHQNIISVSSFLLKNNVNLKNIVDNQLFNKVSEVLNNIKYYNVNIELSGIAFEPNKLIFNYNLPLKDHSLIVDLIFHKDLSIFLTINFLGGSDQEIPRWETLLCFAGITSLASNFELISSHFNYQELTFTLKITSNSKIANLKSDIEFYNYITFPFFLHLEAGDFEKKCKDYAKQLIQQQNTITIQIAIDFINNIISDTSKTYIEYMLALSLLFELSQHNQTTTKSILDKAYDTANQKIQSQDEEGQRKALAIFVELVKHNQNQTYKAAMDAVKSLIPRIEQADEWDLLGIKILTIMLTTELVKKNQNEIYESAIKIVGLYSESFMVPTPIPEAIQELRNALEERDVWPK